MSSSLARRLGATVGGALATWLRDEKLGPLARWKGGLEGGSAQASLWHLRRLDRILGKRLLNNITPKDIERTLLPKHAPATRNRALCAFRRLFGWAVRQGLLEKDPTAGMPKEHETARTRVLSDEEIRTLIKGFDQTRYGRALRLLFLTALRRDEVLGLKWSWIDLERGVLTIPPSVEKTGRVRDELRRTALPLLASVSWPSSARPYSRRASGPNTCSPRAPASARIRTPSSRSCTGSAAADRTAGRHPRTNEPSVATRCCPTT